MSRFVSGLGVIAASRSNNSKGNVSVGPTGRNLNAGAPSGGIHRRRPVGRNLLGANPLLNDLTPLRRGHRFWLSPSGPLLVPVTLESGGSGGLSRAPP